MFAKENLRSFRGTSQTPGSRSKRRRPVLENLDRRLVLATIIVDTAADVVDSTDSLTSLREAVSQANQTAESDSIIFDESVFASPTNIDLLLGEMNVTEDLDLVGPGASNLTIDGQMTSRLFQVESTDVDLSISGIRLTGGRTDGINATVDGSLQTTHNGGAIRFESTGMLSLDSVVLDTNTTAGANSFGGSVSVIGGSLSATNSRVIGSSSSGGGGAISLTDASAEIRGSELAGNQVTASTAVGAAVRLNRSSVRIENSTISGNTNSGANGSAGAIDANDTSVIDLVNSTVVSNTANAETGGISISGATSSLSIHNTIVANNQVGPVSSDLSIGDTGTVDVRFSLIGDNLDTGLVEAQTPDADGNLIGSSGGSGTFDPLLNGLLFDGGQTRTHKPQSGSPVLDAGSDVLAVDNLGAALAGDQRGLPLERFFEAVDIGSVENQPPRSVPINWPDPASIAVGTLLSETQLNASSNFPGTFSYSPDLGTQLTVGDGQTLSVTFDPDDTTHFQQTIATVSINVVEPVDHGDAPDSFSTLRSSGGPFHASGGPILGTLISSEVDGQPGVLADLDDSDDGVTFVSSFVADASRDTVATVRVVASESAKLDAWMDFNGNGSFDHPSEHIGFGTSIDLLAGTNDIPINLPAGTVAGQSYLRFRVSTAGGLLPTGMADDGEVEDYLITVQSTSDQPVAMLDIEGTRIGITADADDFIVTSGRDVFFRVPRDGVSRYEIDADQFSNVFTIDESIASAIPASGLMLDGGDRVNTVQIVSSDLTLDLSAGSIFDFNQIDLIDLGDAGSQNVIVDTASALTMDPGGGGIIISGGSEDSLQIADAALWRMREPEVVGGFAFTVVATTGTFIQTDFSSGWQNVAQPSDVNNSGDVTANDALIIINELSRRSFSDPSNSQLIDAADIDPWPGFYFDQNGDGQATALDALRVINEIARQVDQPSGEAEQFGSFPNSAIFESQDWHTLEERDRIKATDLLFNDELFHVDRLS